MIQPEPEPVVEGRCSRPLRDGTRLRCMRPAVARYQKEDGLIICWRCPNHDALMGGSVNAGWERFEGRAAGFVVTCAVCGEVVDTFVVRGGQQAPIPTGAQTHQCPPRNG